MIALQWLSEATIAQKLRVSEVWEGLDGWHIEDAFGDHGPADAWTWAGERPGEGEEWEDEQPLDARTVQLSWKLADGPSSWEICGMAGHEPCSHKVPVSPRAAIAQAVARRRLLADGRVRGILARHRQREKRKQHARARDKASRKVA